MNETIDLSKLSADELQAELAKRKKEEIDLQKKHEKDYEKDKNDFLTSTISKFTELSHNLEEVKNMTITEANKLNVRMWDIQGKEAPERKTFSVKNDHNKITVDMQEKFEFTEEATVHIQTIKDIFKEKFADRNKAFYNFLESVLMKNSKGEFDPKLLAKGRKQVYEIGDSSLISEFEKLEKCQRVVGTSLYCRVYKKDDKNKWQDINVQFSSL